MAEWIEFTLNGTRHVLSRDQVISRLSRCEPENGRKHLVEVEGRWFPVMQAFEVATGVPRREFISHTARRHLAALGFRVHGDIEPRDSGPHWRSGPSLRRKTPKDPLFGVTSEGEWHTEERVQAILVRWLAAEGYDILSVANTATREHGVDVIARRDGVVTGFEVKGYPSKEYADPKRAGEIKRTSPSTQAGHWYAAAVLAAMRLRGRQPQFRSAIALPDFSRYLDLYAETKSSLVAAQIEMYWISEAGAVLRAE